MKNSNTLIIFLTFSMLLNAAFIGECIHTTCKDTRSLEKPRMEKTVTTTATDYEWDTFIKALAWVESRWDDYAVSPKEAVGYLQITPVVVDDANRICGRELFSLQGRTDRSQSIRIFNVIQNHYNPQHDLQLALKIWNPYSKISYHRAVMQKYQELIEEHTNNHQYANI